jgi:hypothetical protein
LAQWSELRVGTPAIQVQSLAGTASMHFDVYPSALSACFKVDIALHIKKKNHLLYGDGILFL